MKSQILYIHVYPSFTIPPFLSVSFRICPLFTFKNFEIKLIKFVINVPLFGVIQKRDQENFLVSMKKNAKIELEAWGITRKL